MEGASEGGEEGRIEETRRQGDKGTRTGGEEVSRGERKRRGTSEGGGEGNKEKT